MDDVLTLDEQAAQEAFDELRHLDDCEVYGLTEFYPEQEPDPDEDE